MSLLVQTLRNLIGISLWVLLGPIVVYVCGRTVAHHLEWSDETVWLVCAIVAISALLLHYISRV
jgi:hypothetical protein